MRLLRFRVRDFKSVDDSGWIEVSDVTALIGTNESGKTNLLLPLWKLNPAGTGGEIDLLTDAPRKKYNQLRSGDQHEVFVQAVFETNPELRPKLAELTGATPAELTEVEFDRRYDGKYLITFPQDRPLRAVPKADISDLIARTIEAVNGTTALKTEEGLKRALIDALEKAKQSLPESVELVTSKQLTAIQGILGQPSLEGAPKTSVIAPRFIQLREEIDALVGSISRPGAAMSEEARKLVLSQLPKFVYYSNYGNLDSEIYLPHVIENMQRQGIGAREAAKARTLKVLFDFVKLKPQEILELGRELPSNPRPTDEQVAAIAKKKKEREVLLQSASTELTQRFRDWWKQGEYRFRFQADGDHFRIWVADDRRPEDIELEGRSTGLQWFLSFYLIFLVESGAAHQGAILLLDEPGLSLHPLAQRDLSLFFENLAVTNQLLYTTHSPFLVDSNHLDRVRAVYVKDDGTTAVSVDLRAGERDRAATQSIYPVHAALGITVSDTLLIGAQPVIVEGQSDQFYLSAIKTLLVAGNRIAPSRELVFMPAGGVRGVKAIAGVVAGVDDALPVVLVDSDEAGRKLAADLQKGLYAGSKERVLDIGQFVPLKDAEVEDIIPGSVIAAAATRMLRGPEEDFSDVYRAGTPIIGQIEAYAVKYGIDLQPGWKVDLARFVKRALLRTGGADLDEEVLKPWQDLFSRFERQDV